MLHIKIRVISKKRADFLVMYMYISLRDVLKQLTSKLQTGLSSSPALDMTTSYHACDTQPICLN